MTTEPMTTETTDYPRRRYASDLLGLWALCGKPACRRAQACKRNPHSCARRYGALAPEQARVGMLAALQGAEDGVGIEQVGLHFPAEIAALEAWRAQVAGAAARPARDAVDHAQAPA